MEKISEILHPENELENLITSDNEFIEGALWGKARNGHPEGKVVYHIKEVLDNIDRLAPDELRKELRLIALIHDTFKHKVDTTKPKVGLNHHAMIARKFAEKYFDDLDILDVIELHDEAYNAWSVGERRNDWVKAETRLDALLLRLNDQNFKTYKLFYQCDNETGDKTQDNFIWFCNQIK